LDDRDLAVLAASFAAGLDDFFALLDPIYTIEKPFAYCYTLPPSSNIRQANEKYVPHVIPIQSIRGIEDSFTLDRDGFEVLRHETALSVEDFALKEIVKNRYIPETREVLRGKFGAPYKVEIFHWEVSNILVCMY